MEGKHWKLEMPSVGRLRCVFDELNRQFRQNQRRNVPTRGGLLSKVLFLPRNGLDFSRASSQIHQLESEWYFVRTFLYYVDYWADAKMVVHSLECVISKIDFLADETAEDLMKYGKRYSKLMNVISQSQKNIEFLKPEIGEVVESLIECKSELNPSMCDFFFWERLLHMLMRDLDSIKKKVDPSLRPKIAVSENELSGFVTFLADFDFVSYSSVTEFANVMEYAVPVVILMAEQCCLYWFKEMDPNDVKCTLRKIVEKILPTTPECLESVLRLLKSVKDTSPNIGRDHVKIFLRYLFHSEPFGMHEELKGLVKFATNRAEESIEDVESFQSDIKSVVGEAGSLCYLLFRKNRYPHSGELARIKILKAKIWLLKMEIFVKEKLNSSTSVLLSMDGQIETWSGGLKYILGISSEDEREEEVENGKQILKLVEEVAREITLLCEFFHAKRITENKVRISLFIVLLKILFFKAESYFLELLNGSASFIVHDKDQIISLQDGLKLLVAFIRGRPSKQNAKDMELICMHFEAVARRVIFLYHSFHGKQIKEEMKKEIELLLSDLLVKVDLIKAELRDICSRIQRSNFPQTNRLGFIDSVLKNLKVLQNYKADLIGTVNHHIEEIHGGLKFLRSFLVSNIVERNSEHEELKDISKHVMEVAYEVEYVMDSIEVENGAHWQHLLWLYDLSEEIKLLRMEVTKKCKEKVFDMRANNVTPSPSSRMSQASTLEIDEVVVGLGEQEEVIIDQLTRGTSQRDIVSIVGMPGIGKTTLAKKVYYNVKVVYHFHVRAWCSVSQVYSKRELLLDILSHNTGLTDSIHLMTDQDLELELYRQLKQKRYLIVMDDLWNTSAWDDLEASLPDDGKGSRILMTSRLHDVSLKAKHDKSPHLVRLLTNDESWKLLQMKIFHEENCPEELFEVGKKIAQNCKGLPLAIVAAAGLLKQMEKKQQCWNQIVESLSSRVIDDPQTRCMDILELSYKHLADNLKACFLYFGAFLEDKDIPVSRLIWLWAAEGFIQKSQLKSLEDLGKDYLLDLIGRSLIIVAKRRSNGGVKTCRIHDLLRDLCLSKAKEDNFFEPITRFDEPYASFDGSIYGSSFDSYYRSKSITFERHRLCIYLERKHFVQSKPSGSWTRSLLFFATGDRYPRCPYEITFISQNFKLLWVLNLECINIGSSFPVGIESLVQLRYLAVSGDIDSVPSSIANLWKLETFIVKGLKGEVVLPDVLWTMASLRHLHVNTAVLSLEDEELGNFSQLDNLVTLSSPVLSCGRDTEKIIRKIHNIQKLKCIYMGSSDHSKNFNEFPRLDILTRLESLNMLYYGRALYPEFRFPVTLRKLTLSNFRLPWEDISVIGRIQNLEILKLLSKAFEGQTWDMTEGEFVKLKFLKLDTLNVVHWNATSDHLPNLQQLVLHGCKKLEEVPFAFADIPTLQIIEVQHCGQSTEESVRNIEKQGIDGLKILINHSNFYSRSSI